MDAVPFAAGALVAALLAPGALRSFVANGWTRPNYANRRLPFPAGAIAIAAAIVALGILAALDELAGWDVLRPGAAALALGVAFLGLLDDLLDAPARGWRGHAREIARGGFSTGALKALGTLALAAATLAGAGFTTGEFLLAVALVALTTNLFNLLDLRPGRAIKAFVLLTAAIALASWDSEPLRTFGPFAGALVVLGLFDLRERAMLGDTGSNVLGALAGLWLVAALGTMGQAVALAAVLALTVYGELRSITAAIERIGPLRALDRFGRPAEKG